MKVIDGFKKSQSDLMRYVLFYYYCEGIIALINLFSITDTLKLMFDEETLGSCHFCCFLQNDVNF